MYREIRKRKDSTKGAILWFILCNACNIKILAACLCFVYDHGNIFTRLEKAGLTLILAYNLH